MEEIIKDKNNEIQQLKDDRIDLINRCKNEYDLKQKLNTINELLKELEYDYEEIAFMKFTIKLKKLIHGET